MNLIVGSKDAEADAIRFSNKDINRVLIAACMLNNISPKQLEPFLPAQAGLRNTFAFKCLLNIYVYPKQTKTFYAKHFHTCQSATAGAIAYLQSKGLIRSIGRPRLIVPFQRFKVDTAYLVTINGLMVLKKVTEQFDSASS